MKLSELSIDMEFFSQQRIITEARIQLNSANSKIKKFIMVQVQNQELTADFYENFSDIPFAIRNFICYFKNYQDSIIRRENIHTLYLTLPLDYYFLQSMLQFNTKVTINKQSFRLQLSNDPILLQLDYDNKSNRLSIPAHRDHLLLPTHSGNLLLKGNTLHSLISPLSDTLLEQLFRKGEIKMSDELRTKFLRMKRKHSANIERFISLPEVSDFKHYKIIFEFHRKNDIFYLKGFIFTESKNNNYTFALNFSDFRKHILLSEDLIIPLNQNTVSIISPDSEFYLNLRQVVNLVYANFYEFLNEIQENIISTRDYETLFRKFLPSIENLVEIREGQEVLQFLSHSLTSTTLEINEDNSLNDDLENSIDWLAVDFSFAIGDTILSLNDVQQIIQNGYIKKEKNLITLNQQDIDFINELMNTVDLKSNEKGIWRLRRNNLPRILQKNILTKLPTSLEDLPRELKSEKSLRRIKIPSDLDRVLRTYQKIGVYWLNFLHHYRYGGILADEMGLGKTLEVLSFLATIRSEGVSLIICPSSLIYNWAAEIDKFVPQQLTYQVIDGNKASRVSKIKNIQNYDIAITSYNMAHLDLKEYRQIEFNYCILDEAQHIKNMSAKRTQSVKDIRARYRIAITGTPLENSINELWSIFDFVMPHFLGTYSWFQKNFEVPINGFDKSTRNSALKSLKQMINPFILRRTKDNVYKELPNKIEQTIILELTDRQKALYLETLSLVKNKLLTTIRQKGLQKSTLEFLAALTRLRQICLHPGLVYENLLSENSEQVSVKLSALIELVNQAIDSGHRVLVFSQFVSMLRLIRMELKKNDLEYFYIDGKTRNRIQLVDKFNDSDIPIFLISLKAGGIGLNLIGANSVILFDPWWNPAVENQAIDRVHRIGQSKVVNVYRLITKGTIEEKISHLQSRKKEIFDRVIDQENSFIKKLCWEDIQNLLNMKEVVNE